MTETLTEWRFRSYWEQTDKAADETARFGAVIRLMQAPKPTEQPRPDARPARPKPAPLRDAARAIVAPLVEADEALSYTELQEQHGISERTVRDARVYERGRLAGIAEAKAADALIDQSILSKSQQGKFAALEKRLRARLTAVFDDQVQKWVLHHIEDTVMPRYRDKLDKAEMLMKRGRPFSQGEYRDVLAALHPDCIDAERRNRAFMLFKAREVVLRTEEKDRPLTSDLPSKEELLARMRARMEARMKTGRKTP